MKKEYLNLLYGEKTTYFTVIGWEQPNLSWILLCTAYVQIKQIYHEFYFALQYV